MYDASKLNMCILFAFILIQAAQSARILGIFCAPSYSHFVLGETVFKELALRGHDVTVISPYPQKEKLKNYRDLPLEELIEVGNDVKSADNLFKFIEQPVISTIMDTYQIGNVFSELALRNKNVQNLLKSNETFDVIIMEQFLNEAFFGFMHHYKAPLILMATLSSSIMSNGLMGNPTPFSYVPNMFMDYSPEMNYWQRLHNTFVTTLQVLNYHVNFLPEQARILSENFPDAPPIYDLIHNASLMFINSHPTSGAAIPLQPNMIEIGGFHVQKAKPLSEDLKTFLDEAKEGVIYFSLGSNMQSKYLPKEKLEGIFKAFRRLKMKVLWKWEDDHLPGKPDNVRIEKWLPQPAVLAHENVKIFITHGGRLSIIESIYYGKPILGIPIFAEQRSNMREASYLGYGIYLSYADINEENLSRELKELTENPRYAEMAKYRSQCLRDLPTTQLDTAIGWIEYVIKHKGAPHLRNASLHLKWYQYLLLDVALFCLISIWILKMICKTLYFKMFKVERQKIKTN